MNCASLDKSQAVEAGPLFTPIETASNKSNHLVVKSFTQSTLLRNFLNIDYVADTNQNPSKTITTKPLQTKRKAIVLQSLP